MRKRLFYLSARFGVVLELSNVNVSYDRAQVLTDVNLNVDDGEIVALIGSNGAGKTTLTRAISGLTRPASGQISFLGKRIDGKSPKQIVELGLILAREGRGIFTSLTVEENLKLGAYTPNARKKMNESMSKVKGLFPILKARGKQLAGTLSGGEQQMLSIGRALMSLPRLLVLDEPSLGLAPRVVMNMFDVLLELNKEGVTLLIADQNVNYTLRHADRAFVLEIGKIVLSGDAKSLMNNEGIKRSYLGM